VAGREQVGDFLGSGHGQVSSMDTKALAINAMNVSESNGRRPVIVMVVMLGQPLAPRPIPDALHARTRAPSCAQP
jgi:hypothetical protein